MYSLAGGNGINLGGCGGEEEEDEEEVEGKIEIPATAKWKRKGKTSF